MFQYKMKKVDATGVVFTTTRLFYHRREILSLRATLFLNFLVENSPNRCYLVSEAKMKNNDYKNKDGKMKYQNLTVGRVFQWKQAYWIKLENQQAACVTVYQNNKKNYLGQLINIKPENYIHAISYIEIG